MKNSLRRYREGKNWSQKDLGQRLGISPQRVSQLEDSEKPLPEDILKSAARVLGLSAEAIMVEPEGPDSVLEIFDWDQLLSALLKQAGELNSMPMDLRDRGLVRLAQIITAMRSKNARSLAALNDPSAPYKTNPAADLSSKADAAATKALKQAADEERRRGPK